MFHKSLFVLLILISFFLISCDENYIFEKTYKINKGEWLYENTLDYTFEITDTIKIYNLLLELGHSIEYSYQNCYFKIYTQFPSGEKTEQLLSVDLADGVGRWQGDCGGASCTVLVDLQKGAFFNTLGRYTITLEQYMRKNPLKGVESLAIKLEETGLKKE